MREFGIVPPYLAGRNRIINSIGTAFDNWPGDPNLSTILIGPRGCGKTAMLDDAEDSSISDIAVRINKTPGYASTYKKRLMQAGIIEETRRARVKFSMPMFRDYMQKQR